MSPEQQNDILSINQVQLLLSEKRTVLAVMRTGIAVLALPLSIFSALIATSRWYRVMEVWPLLLLVVGINLGLVVFAVYLIARSKGSGEILSGAQSVAPWSVAVCYAGPEAAG